MTVTVVSPLPAYICGNCNELKALELVVRGIIIQVRGAKKVQEMCTL